MNVAFLSEKLVKCGVVRFFGHIFSSALFLLAGLTYAENAHAQTGGASCSFSSSVTGEVTLSDLDLNAPKYTAYFSAYFGQFAEAEFSCTGYINPTSSLIIVGPTDTDVRVTVTTVPPSIATVAFFGEQHVIHSLPGNTGLGYILVWDGTYHSNPQSLKSGTVIKQIFNNWLPIEGFSFSSGITGRIGAVLVKVIDEPLSPSLAGTTINISPVSAYAQLGFKFEYHEYGSGHAPTVVNVNSAPTTAVPFNYQFHITSIISAGPPTCATPDIPNQTIPALPVNSFNGQNTWAGGKDFTMQFTNCSNHSKIRYKIDPSGDSPDPSQGLLPLISPSTASGLAVQVMDQGNITSLGTWRDINTSASNYSVPMYVRYYQTAANVMAGHVQAGMTISFQYQ